MIEPVRLSKQPVIYEINTAVFLSGLSEKYDRQIKLGTVPEEEWRMIAALPVDAVWLMGIWERSPESRKLSMHNKDLKESLPDFSEKDNLGSAYSIRTYEVNKLFGGDEGLAQARAALRRNKLGLILDFVPNHIAIDSDWAEHHPEYLVPALKEDKGQKHHAYTKTTHGLFANGKDPEFPAWSDVLQLNAYSPELRKAATKILTKIATQCDGVRCDMAMLMLNPIFRLTWGEHVGTPPHTEYWTDVIEGVREKYSEFTFIAEVYWDLERRLLELGFDYCYDKTLYDKLAEDTSLELFQYLHIDRAYQGRLLRFIENHDEPRAVNVFKGPKLKAAAFVLATVPGATMYHQGQLEGFRTKLPVHLGRGPHEVVNEGADTFYRELISQVGYAHMRSGVWQLCRGNNGLLRSTKLIAWSWTRGKYCFLCVVNYNDHVAKGKIELPSLSPSDLTIILGEEMIRLQSMTLYEEWLTLELRPWGYTLLRFMAQSGSEHPSTSA